MMMIFRPVDGPKHRANISDVNRTLRHETKTRPELLVSELLHNFLETEMRLRLFIPGPRRG